jgi:paraquat-inducible protein B
VKNVDNSIGPLITGIEGTLKSLDATMIVAQKSMDEIAGATGENSPMVYEMNRTLEEVQALARSIRVLADHLERRPETLIRGK